MKPRGPASPLLVITTCGTDAQAARLARALVQRKLAACVNIIRGVRSIYRWKGKVAVGTERLLLIKTTRGAYEELAATIRSLHPYELPEILAVEPSRADPRFAAWIATSTK